MEGLTVSHDCCHCTLDKAMSALISFWCTIKIPYQPETDMTAMEIELSTFCLKKKESHVSTSSATPAINFLKRFVGELIINCDFVFFFIYQGWTLMISTFLTREIKSRNVLEYL